MYAFCVWIVCLALGISSCVQETKRFTVSGCVADASMNNITLVTLAGDTLNISKMDADPVKVPGVLVNDSVTLTYRVEHVGDSKILQAEELAITKHSPFFFIQGTWLEPNPINAAEVQGVILKEDGTASSVGMETLLFEKWELNGNQLLLTSKSVGSGQTLEGVDTLQVEKLDADSLVLSRAGYTIWQFGRK